MIEEMDEHGVTLTAEDTITARMKAILDGGLPDATFSSFLDVTGAYEDWNEVLETPIPEATRAHAYKKLVMNISRNVRSEMTITLATLESKAAAKGRDPAKDEPIELITQAASLVLDDMQNEETQKNIEDGRAFAAGGRFDPLRSKRERDVRPPGGQTWASNYRGPTDWQQEMRD